ncbi:MAG: PAS domain S-box protein [Prolixibacteraceae bacterium]|jgi:PAS domain S-box-containing protein|nr:PAS domain S-box protein [Prolixibacteraceae bacterium]
MKPYKLNRGWSEEIIIVDDAADSLKLLSNILETAGYAVRTAEHGNLALSSIKMKKPSLVLLDVMMPEMDGFEVCRRLKADENTRDIPVIFISALDDERSKITGFQVGGVDYISKPIRREEVLARIGVHIRLLRLQLQLEKRNRELQEEIGKRRQSEHILLESEEKYKNLFNSIRDAILVADTTRKIIQCNPAFSDLFGYLPEEIIGQSALIIYKNEDEFEETDRTISENIDNPNFLFPVYYKKKNGHVFSGETNVFFLLDNHNEVIGFIGVIRDITERKKLEQDQFRLLHIIEKSLNEIYIFDSETLKFEYANRGALKNLGYASDEIKKLGPLDIRPGYTEESFMKAVEPLVLGKENKIVFETVHRRKDGTDYPVEVHLQLHRQKGKNLFLAVINDITLRKQTEKALAESEDMFRKLAVSTPVAICIYQDDRWVYVNPAGERLSGYTLEEYGEMGFWEFVAPEYQELIKARAKERLAGIENSEGFEFRIIRKDGQARWVYLKGSLIAYKGKPAGLISVIDITEKKQMEDRLRQNEEFYRSMFEKNLAVMLLIDPQDGAIIDANEAASGFYGWTHDQLVRMKISQINTLSYEELVVEMRNAVSSQRNFFQFTHRIADGTVKDVEVYSSKIFREGKDLLLSIIHDVSERKKAEAGLLEANQKMDAFFNQSLDGFFFMMLDEPVEWNEDADKEKLLEYAFSHQRMTRVNDALLAQYRATRNQLTGMAFRDLFAHDPEQGKNELRKLFDQGKLHTETEERNLKGEQVIIEGDYTCLYDPEGRITGHFGIQRDITENKKIAEVLKESENKYRYLFENNPAPMWIYDLETLSFLEVNEAAVNHYGYSRREFLNMTIKDIRPEEDVDLLMENVKSGNFSFSRSGSWRHLKKNGEILSVEIASHSLDFEGKKARLVISTDITEQINTQLELQREKQLLRTLIDNLPVSIYVKNTEGRKIVSNLTNVENMGYKTEAEVLGKTDMELYGGEIGIRGYADDMTVIKTGKPILNKEEYFFGTNGSYRWNLTSKIPLFNQYGKVSGLVGIGRDITEQKEAIGTIQKLSKGIEQNPSSIIITNIQGDIEYVNPKFTEVTGYSPDEAIGKSPCILKSGETPPEKYKELWATISQGGVWRGELCNRKKNGELYWEWATITSIKNDKGETTNYIAIKEDISLRKQMEADLVEAKEKAEQSDRLKSAFLANMSHEIRTPMNSIIGFSELLSDPSFDEKQKDEFVRHIVGSGNNLLNIINDIMDISKIESGEIAIREVPLHVEDFIEEVRSRFEIRVREKGLEFSLDQLEKNKNIYILADPDRLSQVFNNLVSNALKFTEEGSIRLGYGLSEGHVQFYVRDSGIGIPEEYHSAIFERFRQVETSYTRKHGENGLGLAISKNLVEIMGGKIWVTGNSDGHREEKGSTFYFTVPVVRSGH